MPQSACTRASLTLASILLLAAPAQHAAPVEVPEFTKEDAKKILLAQEWQNVRVIAVINGVSIAKVASSSLSHVLALAYRDGKWADLKFDVYYDRDLGWFTYEASNTKYRIWNSNGYQEIEPRIGW